MDQYKILEWDSAFFGYKVALLIQSSYNYSELRNVLQNLKVENVKLVYWSPENKNNINDLQIAPLGGKLVDIKTVYRINLEGKSTDDFKKDKRVKEYTDIVMHPDLLALAYESGTWSRYNVDERIGRKKFEELYKIWMEKSVAKEFAKTILITGQGSRITGMITLGEKDGVGKLGLAAVDPAHREKGLGYALFMETFRWFIQYGYKRVNVVTQEANESACRLYELLGFEKISSNRFYHFWI